ncbi:ParB N-terminal domain-containing protein [Leptospira interrogans]|uniref:ParB N-terminal domain-containing protein n=1 Tax=Leptospira interrogans TaxID=173 RepID=UPI0002BA6CA7|nr:ParB N-terminal domain-containing protein [Leptospira interrogans]AJR16678.1 putative chromosome partitioning parB family protein [Leptospira interrogans serovar Linhai str. 56609]QOI36761.1 chromosome partitioning protein ParB [Leptospira interrogans serovar Icterohaemorrhagiae]EMN93350.1 ParB-like protein [Leptospira interrogans serovar Medanensis str. UT053]EMO00872.1 ParB-like protein [Leptospira interrogans serovar Pomona str. UT364]ULG86747.1 ParB N-terminal domain-containing protein 
MADIQKFKPTKLYYENPEKLIIVEDQPFALLQGEQYEELRESIKRNGILHPVYCRQDYTVLSGSNRVVIAQELGILVPTIRFQVDMDPDIEQELVYHLNTVGRQVSPADRKRLVFTRFKNQIGKSGGLKAIHQLTGIHISTLKQYSVEFQNKKKFENIGISEEDRKAGIRLYLKWDKFRIAENEAKRERQKLERQLSELAPLSYWTKEGWKKKVKS